jgi:hypothetical protein
MANYKTGFHNGCLGIGLPIFDLSKGRLDEPDTIIFDTNAHPNYNTEDVGGGGLPKYALDINGNIKLTGAILNRNGDLQQLRQDVYSLPVVNDDLLDENGDAVSYTPPNMIDENKDFRIDGSLYTNKLSELSKISIISPIDEEIILDISNLAFRQPYFRINIDDDNSCISSLNAPGIDVSGNVKISGNVSLNLDYGESSPVDTTFLLRKNRGSVKNIIQINDKGFIFNKDVPALNAMEIPNNIIIGKAYVHEKKTTYENSMLIQGRLGIKTYKPLFPLHVEGSGGVSALQYVERSDKRLKSNIKTIKNSLGKINQLNGVYYENRYLENKNRYIGFIAQDVEKIVPEVIYNIKGETSFKTVKYNGLISLLIEGIKELTGKLEKCELKINGMV